MSGVEDVNKVYVQYGKLSWHWPQYWKEGETEDKAGQGS